MSTPERITLNFPIEHDGVPIADIALRRRASLRGLITYLWVLWSNLNGHFDRVLSPRQGT